METQRPNLTSPIDDHHEACHINALATIWGAATHEQVTVVVRAGREVVGSVLNALKDTHDVLGSVALQGSDQQSGSETR